MEKHHFYQASMEYVLLLQEMHERKKFEFVEIVSGCCCCLVAMETDCTVWPL